MRRVVSCCLLLLLLQLHRADAQSLSLYDIDARAYPLLRAKLLLYDAGGNRMLSLSPQQLLLTENGTPRNILRVDCPPINSPTPISAVLTIDASGSMYGPGIVLAQAAANAWIDAFPAGQSECALTSFDFSNVLHQDFTNDRDVLRGAVGGLSAGGGTSFDAAFTKPFAGALRVAERGKYRRVVVLLTDGHATGDENAILAMARQTNARIYCVTLDNRMPDILRNVAEQTGGRWFENVRDASEAASIFRSILDMAQDLPPCVIEWESGGCDYIRSVVCESVDVGARGTAMYSVSSDDLPLLDVTPSRVIAFGEIMPGSFGTQSVTITAVHADVEIRSIIPEYGMFVISDFGGSSPPFTLLQGQSRTLTLRYDATDSGYVICRFDVQTSACEGGFFATAGTPGAGRDWRTITLLHPNGGEVFIAGSDTVITWKGVAPTDPVNLEYSTNTGATWQRVASNISGLSYKWRVPNTPSDQCLVRVTARLPLTVPEGMVIVPAATYEMGDLTGMGTQDERPSHTVSLTQSFLMSETEITQRQWIDVMGDNPSVTLGETHPVHGVSWIDAVAYCNKRSGLEGLDSCYIANGSLIYCDFGKNGYRLPTEAEWELACRAGSTLDFSVGPMQEPYCTPIDPVLDRTGWYCGNTGDPQPVAQKNPNALGLFDMHGNAGELCWDEFSNYVTSNQTDPVGQNPRPAGMSALVRGGHWKESATGCRSSRREQVATNRNRVTDGFRVVRTY